MKRLSPMMLVFFLGINLIWGATFVTVKKSLEYMGVFPFLFWRFFLGAMVIMFFILYKGRYNLNRKTVIGGIIAGIALFGGYFFQTLGLKYTEATRSGFITSLFIVMIPIFSFLILKHIPTKKNFIGIVLSFAGIYFFSTNADFSFYMNKGDLITVLCAISFGIQIPLVSYFVKNENILEFTFIELLFVSLLAGVYSLFSGDSFVLINDFMYFSIILCGIFATGICFLGQSIVQNKVSPTQAAVFYTTEPLFAGLTGFLVFNERLSTIQIIGASFIIAGILVSEMRRQKEI